MRSLYRNDGLWMRLTILALAMLFLSAARLPGDLDPTRPTRQPEVTRPPRTAMADIEIWAPIESNTFLFRRALENGAVLVAYGSERDTQEYQSLCEALAVYPCEGVNETLLEELDALRSEWRAALFRRIPTEVERLVGCLDAEWLLAALAEAAGSGTVVRRTLEEFEVEIGIATYRYWKSTTRLRSGATDLRHHATEQVIFLPGTYQPYLRLVLRP